MIIRLKARGIDAAFLKPIKRFFAFFMGYGANTGLAILDVAAELHFGDNGAYRVC